jgi:hypothetical protein
MARKEKKTAATSERISDALKGSKERYTVGPAQTLSVRRDAQAFEAFFGHTVPSAAKQFGLISLSKMSASDAREWRKFSQAADKVQDWYNGVRKRFAASVVDTVCKAISESHPNDPVAAIYSDEKKASPSSFDKNLRTNTWATSSIADMLGCDRHHLRTGEVAEDL